MGFHCASRVRTYVFEACLVFAFGTGFTCAADNDADLHSVFEKQQKQIEELQKRLEATPVAVVVRGGSAENVGQAARSEDVVKSIASDYIKEKSATPKGLLGKLVSHSNKGS